MLPRSVRTAYSLKAKPTHNVSRKSLSLLASMSPQNKTQVHKLGIDIHTIIDSISENSPNMIMDFNEITISKEMITNIMYNKPGALKRFFTEAGVTIFDETATDNDYLTLCQSVMIYCIINPTYFSTFFKKVINDHIGILNFFLTRKKNFYENYFVER